MSAMTFAEGSGSTISTTGTNAYVIESIFKSRTVLSNQATPTTDLATGNAFIPMPVPGTTTGLPPGVPSAPLLGGYACAFTLGFNAAGDLLAIQGPIVALNTSGTFIQGAPSLSPSLGPPGPNAGTTAAITADNDFCPCGYIVVLSDSAKDLGISITPEIVKRAEKLLENELGPRTAKHFACNMNVYTLAILEPKDL